MKDHAQATRAAFLRAQVKHRRIGLIVRTSQSQSTDAKSSTLVLFQDLAESRQVTVKLASTEQRFGYQVFDWVIPLRNMKSTPK